MTDMLNDCLPRTDSLAALSMAGRQLRRQNQNTPCGMPVSARIARVADIALQPLASAQTGHLSGRSSGMEKTASDQSLAHAHDNVEPGPSIIKKKYLQITAQHIEDSRITKQEKREHASTNAFARRHNVNMHNETSLADKHGSPAQQGKKLLEQTKRQPSEAIRCIEPRHFAQWQAYAQKQRDQISIAGFASVNKLDPILLSSYLSANGSPTAIGNNVLARLKKKYLPVTPDTEETSASANTQGSKNVFYPIQWQALISETGELTRNGKKLLEEAHKHHDRMVDCVAARHLEKWLAISPEQRTTLGVAGFATQNKLNPKSLLLYLNQNGNMNHRGKKMLARFKKQYRPITARDLQEWENHRDTNGNGVKNYRYAHQHNFDINRWRVLVNKQGEITSMGKKRINLAQKRFDHHATDPAASGSHDNDLAVPPVAASPDLILIKKEPGELDPSALPRSINNHLPILQEPAHPHASILTRTEGPIEQLRISNWGNLHSLFAAIAPDELKTIKAAILADVKDWLHAEGSHAVRFEQMMEVGIPIDIGPARGDSVYAKCPISKYTVLGPYAGALHISDASLQKEIRQYGQTPVLRYLWGTNAASRSVSGLRTGNILSLLNTGHLQGTAQVLGDNNVGAIRVGKNLTFYVALKDIKKGDELLVNYGESYNPRREEIKTELPDETA